MSVLIVSIHVAHRNSQYWRKLQPQFISDNTTDYSYGVVVNGDDSTKYQNVIYHTNKQLPHLQCINVVVEYFKKNNYDRFLILDSDCWPIKKDWNRILDGMLGHNYLYAAPMRTENFDNFPHPCAFYMKREALEIVDFNFSRINNLLGIDISDVGAAMPQSINNRQVWLPLIKTNYLCPHPVYASIYGDLFYHHCAGSRGLGFRSAQYAFYKHILDQRLHKKIYQDLTSTLLSSPRLYIAELRGRLKDGVAEKQTRLRRRRKNQ